MGGNRQGLTGGSVVKNPPAIAGFDLWVGKIPWENEMATHYSILAWEIPWKRNLVDYSPWGCKESDMTITFFHFQVLKPVGLRDCERGELRTRG